MGLPLEPTMTTMVFLSLCKLKWLEEYPSKFKPVFNRWYVDDIFVLFESAQYLSKFYVYLNTYHPNMFFSFEQIKW